jgi:hypothetical protein
MVWEKKMRSSFRTSGHLSQANGEISRVLLKRMVLTLIVERSFDQEQFAAHSKSILELMNQSGLFLLEADFEDLLKNKQRWAPYMRKNLNRAVFNNYDVLCKHIYSNNSLESFFGWIKHTVFRSPQKSMSFFLSRFLEVVTSHYRCAIQKAGLLPRLVEHGKSANTLFVPNTVSLPPESLKMNYDLSLMRKKVRPGRSFDDDEDRPGLTFPTESLATHMKLLQDPAVLEAKIEFATTVSLTFPILRRALMKKQRSSLIRLGAYVGTPVIYKSWRVDKMVQTVLDRLKLLAGAEDVTEVGDVGKKSNGEVVFVLGSRTGSQGHMITVCSETLNFPHVLLNGDGFSGDVTGISCECPFHWKKNSLLLPTPRLDAA